MYQQFFEMAVGEGRGVVGALGGSGRGNVCHWNQHLPKVLELDGDVTKVIGVLSTVYDSTMHIFDKAY